MKLFSWVQNKFNAKQGNAKPHHPPVVPYQRKKEADQKEEFSDWPDSLLRIGTFGNNDLKQNPQTPRNQEEDQNDHLHQSSSSPSSPDLTEFTPEEVGKLQKELTKLLSRKPVASAASAVAQNDLPLDRFLNCPSSLEVDRRNSSTLSTNSDNINNNNNDNNNCNDEEEIIDRTIRAIIGRCKDVCEKSKKRNVIGKKSISFLLKKVFVCTSGFSPTPPLRDTFQESRMEKLLRTMLSKKIYSQSSSFNSRSMKRYLEDKQISSKVDNDDDHGDEKRRERTCDSGRWDKTDSDFIVLEI